MITIVVAMAAFGICRSSPRRPAYHEQIMTAPTHTITSSTSASQRIFSSPNMGVLGLDYPTSDSTIFTFNITDSRGTVNSAEISISDQWQWAGKQQHATCNLIQLTSNAERVSALLYDATTNSFRVTETNLSVQITSLLGQASVNIDCTSLHYHDQSNSYYYDLVSGRLLQSFVNSTTRHTPDHHYVWDYTTQAIYRLNSTGSYSRVFNLTILHQFAVLESLNDRLIARAFQGFGTLASGQLQNLTLDSLAGHELTFSEYIFKGREAELSLLGHHRINSSQPMQGRSIHWASSEDLTRILIAYYSPYLFSVKVFIKTIDYDQQKVLSVITLPQQAIRLQNILHNAPLNASRVVFELENRGLAVSTPTQLDIYSFHGRYLLYQVTYALTTPLSSRVGHLAITSTHKSLNCTLFTTPTNGSFMWSEASVDYLSMFASPGAPQPIISFRVPRHNVTFFFSSTAFPLWVWYEWTGSQTRVELRWYDHSNYSSYLREEVQFANSVWEHVHVQSPYGIIVEDLDARRIKLMVPDLNYIKQTTFIDVTNVFNSISADNYTQMNIWLSNDLTRMRLADRIIANTSSNYQDFQWISNNLNTDNIDNDVRYAFQPNGSIYIFDQGSLSFILYANVANYNFSQHQGTNYTLHSNGNILVYVMIKSGRLRIVYFVSANQSVYDQTEEYDQDPLVFISTYATKVVICGLNNGTTANKILLLQTEEPYVQETEVDEHLRRLDPMSTYVHIVDDYIYSKQLNTTTLPLVNRLYWFKQDTFLSLLYEAELPQTDPYWVQSFIIVNISTKRPQIFHEYNNGTAVTVYKVEVSPKGKQNSLDKATRVSDSAQYLCQLGSKECSRGGMIEQCFDGYFHDSKASGVCEKCEGDCSSCLLTDPASCTACHQGFYLTLQNRCLRCSSSCAACNSSQDNCVSCSRGAYLNGSTCHSCPQNCQSCLNSSTCNQCQPKYTLADDNLTCLKCLATCTSCNSSNPSQCSGCQFGLFLDSSDGTCRECSPNCLTCVSNTTCFACLPHHQITSQGKCRRTCSLLCAQCDDNDPEVCTACFDSYTLENGACQISLALCSLSSNSPQCFECVAGSMTYLNSLSQCLPCPPIDNCIQCHPYDTHLCHSCFPGYYLAANLTCIQCPSNCSTCHSSDSCLSCQTGYFSSLYPSQAVCQKCHFSCQTCFKWPDFCTSCPGNQQLTGRRCSQSQNLTLFLTLNSVMDDVLSSYRLIFEAIENKLTGNDALLKEDIELIITKIQIGSVKLEMDVTSSTNSSNNLKQAHSNIDTLQQDQQLAGLRVSSFDSKINIDDGGGPPCCSDFNIWIIVGIVLSALALVCLGLYGVKRCMCTANVYEAEQNQDQNQVNYHQREPAQGRGIQQDIQTN